MKDGQTLPRWLYSTSAERTRDPASELARRRPSNAREPGRTRHMTLMLLSAGGWALVAYVVLTLPVTPTAEAIFYAGAFGALAGSWALLAKAVYRHRFQRELGLVGALSGGLRFALAVEFGLWLQSLHMLTVP